MPITPEDILDFWNNTIGRDAWFSADTRHDSNMRERFAEVHGMAAKNELPSWKKTPEGMLALILLLLEFPHRMFRGTSRAFETDDLALEFARESIVQHFDDRIDKTYKLIFYLPYLNSESRGDQRLSLFYIRERTKENDWLIIAERAFETIETFGRFPERNKILGRESTPAEVAFLQEPKA